VQLQLVKLERERARVRNISFPVTKRRNEKLHKEGNEKSLKKDPKKRKSVRSFFFWKTITFLLLSVAFLLHYMSKSLEIGGF
jgi:cell division septal protein FtsQ